MTVMRRFLKPSLEPLESRIAPATLISSTQVQYTDPDGDLVTVTTTRGTFDDPTAVGQTMWTFVASGAGELLQALELGSDRDFRSAVLTIAVEGAATADVGFIDASDIDLKEISVDGDLARFNVGDRTGSTPGLALLKVGSIGVLGLTTQEAGGTLSSEVRGNLTRLEIAGDLNAAILNVERSIASGLIGGNVIGGDLFQSGSILVGDQISNLTVNGKLTGALGDSSGRIGASDGIRDLIINGGIEGGSGANSGQVGTDKGLTRVTVGGVGIIGGSGITSGALAAKGTIDRITVAAPAGISLQGGSGELSGTIGSASSVKRVELAGGILGGSGELSGTIVSDNTLDSVIVHGVVEGGSGFESGAIGATSKVTRVTVDGLQAGTGGRSGSILCDIRTNSFTDDIVIQGDIIGTPDSGIAGLNSALVRGSRVGSLLVTGNVIGGNGEGSGGLLSNAATDSVEIQGNLQGGSGAFSGAVRTDGALKTVTVGGSVIGGTGSESGLIDAEGKLTTVRIGTSIIGGVGDASGTVQSTISVGTVTIGQNLQGGAGAASGSILSSGDISRVTINGSLIGGSGDFSGSIETASEFGEADITTVTIVGNLSGGSGVNSAQIFSSGFLKTVTIGNIIGGSGTNSAGISADGRITTITVNGDIRGGIGADSAKIVGGANLDTLNVGGSIEGRNTDYGISLDTTATVGQVYVVGKLGKLDIGEDLVGGSGPYGAQIRAAEIGTALIGGSIFGTTTETGALIAEIGDIDTVRILGGLTSTGETNTAGRISAAEKIGTVTIGSVDGRFVGSAAPLPEPALVPRGGFEASNHATINAGKSISRVTIQGSAQFLEIAAGFGANLEPITPAATVGTVSIGSSTEDIISGISIVAGVLPGGDGVYGTSNDFHIFTEDISGTVTGSIASVILEGIVVPTTSFSDNFGIVAHRVSSVRVNGIAAILQSGSGNDSGQNRVPIGPENTDIFVNEPPASSSA